MSPTGCRSNVHLWVERLLSRNRWVRAVKTFPPLADVADPPPDLFAGGHLWIQEYLDGAHLRVQLAESGQLRFGDRTRVWGDAPPPAYEYVARHVREQLDREALRRAVEDVESVVFFGTAMHRHRLDYDWARTPPFLGFAVWSGGRERFLPPDAVEGIYERLGLDPVNAVAKEVRAVDVSPRAYTIPESAWRDGPAAGVVFVDKTGNRAKLLHPDYAAATHDPPATLTAEELAREATDDDRLGRIVAALRADGTSVDFDAVYERALTTAIRARHDWLFGDRGERGDVVRRQFRGEVAARVREYLAGSGSG